MGVQRLEALKHRDGYKEVPSRVADQPFDFALVIAFARTTEPILEQVMRLQLGEDARPLPLAVAENPGHRDLAEECERPNVAVAECFRRLRRIAHHKAGVRVRQVKSEEVDLALGATNDADRFPEVGLRMPRRMHQRYEHLLRSLPPAGHIILHDRDATREAVLISQPLENPLRRMLLLLRS